MTKAFISHSSLDIDFAQQIARLLVELGVHVWIDVSDILGGTYWGDEIQQALNDCELMLLILSPESMASDNVKDEWAYFRGKHKTIIPLLLRKVDVHYQLYRLQYVDFTNKSFTAAFADLCMTLKSRGYRVGTPSSRRPFFLPPTEDGVNDPLPPGRLYQIGAPRTKALPPSAVLPAEPVAPPPHEKAPSPPMVIRAKSATVADILPPPFEWIEIRGGKVTLADGRLFPKTGAPLPTFSIARYPTTNGQFRVFEEAPDGYCNEAWWNFSDGARRWRQANPYPHAPGFPGDDHPRTEVCWYEAVAFCRWLAFCVGAQQTVQSIALPTVQQWHWAAVADTGWSFPWADRFVRGCCNTAESQLGQTTPVTQYPQGASPFGVMDMCGNCWEWCLNDWVSGSADIRHEAEQRFILGGSWNDSRDYVCVQHQPCREPGLRENTQGFRIAATFGRM